MKSLWQATWLCIILAGCAPSADDENGGGGSNGGPATGTATTTTGNDPLPEGQTEPQVPEESESAESTDSEETGEASSSDVSLQQLDWDGVMGLVGAHDGKVVVVDLWSLSCEPCIVEFPHLVALAEQYPEQVACISVATDYQGLANRPLSHYEPRVLEFLLGQNASNVENVLCTTPKPEFFAELEIGSEPAIYVFDQSGTPTLFTGLQADDTEVSYERHVIPHIESLLAGSQ